MPKERILEHHVREGWAPLCNWLGKDIPKIEMPKGNMGAGFEGRVEQIHAEWMKETMRNMTWAFGMLLAGVAVAGFYVWRSCD